MLACPAAGVAQSIVFECSLTVSSGSSSTQVTRVIRVGPGELSMYIPADRRWSNECNEHRVCHSDSTSFVLRLNSELLRYEKRIDIRTGEYRAELGTASQTSMSERGTCRRSADPLGN